MLKKNILSLQPKSTRLPRKGMLILFKNDTYRGVEQLVARQAHNLEVACSSLASATNIIRECLYKAFPNVFYHISDKRGTR